MIENIESKILKLNIRKLMKIRIKNTMLTEKKFILSKTQPDL